MLVYLDALIAALTVRDADEVTRLLAHPLARLLPDEVRDEAREIAEGPRDTPAAPLRAMQLRFRTAELLRETPPRADQLESPEAVRVPVAATRATRGGLPQMELPLSA